MQMVLRSVFLAAILGISACGQYSRLDEGGFTEVTFRNGTKALEAGGPEAKTAQLPGGILIYIYSDNFATNLKLDDETGTASLRLPNGSYSFYAFGYDDNSVPFAANLKCAVVGGSTPIAMNGTPQSIVLALAQANCADGTFVESAGFAYSGSQFNKLELFHCPSSMPLTGVTGTSNCVAGWFAANRYRVIAPLYKMENGEFTVTGTAITGACQVANTSGGASTASSTERFPVGTTAGRSGLFAIEIETFSDASCTTTPITRHRFRNGLIFGPNPDDSAYAKAVTTGTDKTRLFLREF